MRGAVPSLPSTLSWCGAKLKYRDNFTFYLILYFESVIYRKKVTYCFVRFQFLTLKKAMFWTWLMEKSERLELILDWVIRYLTIMMHQLAIQFIFIISGNDKESTEERHGEVVRMN
jgi:hypothetical protein